ncbi:hypothetical protein RK927_05535 [Streptococcus pneumoniae]|nr:hypothetical protein [Streptococcus pneumoniae]MDS3413919.1 hypothetical protein [Streptococcus pneumoniae]MDS4757400.1 hypothetical protein [Streptococcus pneumoniae]MDS8175297.1 hypothetical protein [Streptococcus pneumoniae]
MTRIELENRVWLLANHEEKNELLDLANVKGQICETSAGTWKGVCACLITTEI